MLQKTLVTGLLFCCLLLLFFSPLLIRSSTHTTSVNDGALIVWLSHQSANALTGKGDWYNWPFFYPYQFTATYSDPFVTSGALLLLIRQFTSNITLQYNLLLMISACTNFWAVYLLAQKLWKNYFASIVSASVFTFSYTQYQFIPHLHSYLLFGLPLGVWTLISYIESGRKKYALYWGICFVLQSLNAPMTGYFFLAVTILYLFSTRQYRKIICNTFWWSSVVISSGLLIWYYLPYVRTAQDFSAIRTIRDTAHFSYPIEKLLSIEIFLPLIFFALYLTKVRQKIDQSSKYLIIAITSFILCGALFMLGPVVKVGDETLKILGVPIPLPYAILYYVIPGIQAFRSVSRWAIVLNLGLALGLGWVVQQQLKEGRKKIVLFFFALYISLSYVLELKNQYLYPTPQTIPEIYSLVKTRPERIVAELPVYQWNNGTLAGQENQRLRYQLYHEKVLFNGVSGLTPPRRAHELTLLQQQFPDTESVILLQSTGVELIVVHFDEYQQLGDLTDTANTSQPMMSDRLLTTLEHSPALTLIGCTDQPHDCVFKIE